MPWRASTRPPWWALLLSVLFCWLSIFCCQNKGAAGVRVSASAAPVGATSAEQLRLARAGSYDRFYFMADPPTKQAVPLQVLQQQGRNGRELQQPLEQQQPQQQEQSKNVFMQAQQQREAADPLQPMRDQQNDVLLWETSKSPIDYLTQQQQPDSLEYPEGLPVPSHVQQHQQLDGDMLGLQPLEQEEVQPKSEQSPGSTTISPHPAHYLSASSVPQQNTGPAKLPSLLVEPGAAQPPAEAPATVQNPYAGESAQESQVEGETTPAETPAANWSQRLDEQQLVQEQNPGSQQEQTPPQWQQQMGEENVAVRQQQATPQWMHRKDEVCATGPRVPSFSALPENFWDYKQHGRDWGGLCAEGQRQSPVDLHIEGLPERQYRNLTAMYRRAFSGGEDGYYPSAISPGRRPWRRGDFFYFYPNSIPTLQVYRSSAVFQVRAAKSSMTSLGAFFPTDAAEMLTAQHIFFHSPSEHTFQGEANRREVEMQIWHFSDDPITFRACTGVNRTTLPYLALFAEGSLGLPAATGPEGEGANPTDHFGNTVYQPADAGAAAAPSDLSSLGAAGSASTRGAGDNVISSGQTAARGGEQSDQEESTGAYEGLSPHSEAISAIEMGSKVSPASATATAAEGPAQSGAVEGTPQQTATSTKPEQDCTQGNQGDMWSPTAHWRVLSLTFMSEELDQATVQDLKSLPSERLISTLLQAEMGNATETLGEQTIQLNEPLNLQALMMMLQLSNTEFFAYDGSSTMPPCEENVRWYVARQPLPVATETMLRFYKLLNPSPIVASTDRDGNFRHLQNVDSSQMRNIGNVYLVQGFPVQLLVASSLGFEAMARLPRGEAPALRTFFGISPSSTPSAAMPTHAHPPILLATTTTLLLLLVSTLGFAELLAFSV